MCLVPNVVLGALIGILDGELIMLSALILLSRFETNPNYIWIKSKETKHEINKE